MTLETITDERDLLIRRMVLAPGEATPWHLDRCRRFTVVVRGERLQIELEGSDESHTASVYPGLAEWGRTHRGDPPSHQHGIWSLRGGRDLDTKPYAGEVLRVGAE
jgi:hypothetical protein